MAPSRLKQDAAAFETAQEDRQSLHHSMMCHDKCVSHYMTNTMILGEKTCMENCLWKLYQSTIITNINYSKFTEYVAKGGKLQ